MFRYNSFQTLDCRWRLKFRDLSQNELEGRKGGQDHVEDQGSKSLSQIHYLNELEVGQADSARVQLTLRIG